MGTFLKSVTKRFGAKAADSAERQVSALKEKFPNDPSRAFAITNARLNKAKNRGLGRRP